MKKKKRKKLRAAIIQAMIASMTKQGWPDDRAALTPHYWTLIAGSRGEINMRHIANRIIKELRL